MALLVSEEKLRDVLKRVVETVAKWDDYEMDDYNPLLLRQLYNQSVEECRKP